MKSMREKLQMREMKDPKTSLPKTTLKFGSFNVNGLDLEVGWSVQQLLREREYDVSYKTKQLTIVYDDHIDTYIKLIEKLSNT